MASSKPSKKKLKEMEKVMQNSADWLSRALDQAKTGFEAAADNILSEKISGILSGAIPVPISYEDSDQSPLKYKKAQLLRNLWAGGMDYLPYSPRFFYLSDWMKTIYSGDYEGFLKMIEGKSEDNLKKMLTKRESLYNVSAIFHVVIGARNQHPLIIEQSKCTLNVKNEHMKILVKLLSIGIDVNVHDFAGFTPLHHCVSSVGNDVTFKMAERLLRAGANVNSQNRFGETPLMNACMSVGNTVHYAAVEMLLKYGADPTVKDNEGNFPTYTFRINPKLQQMFGESYKKNMKDKMKEPDYESRSKCNVCGAKSDKTKKCSGCFKVWYCGSKCQKEDWSQHKGQCQETKSQYIIGKHDGEYMSSYMSAMSKPSVSDPPDINKNLTKKHFAVKVQITLHNRGKPDYESGLVIYNRDKSFHVRLLKKGNEVLHKKLRHKITSDGYAGLKGYFHAILEPGDKEANQFRINPENIFIEPW